jgi:hypothetical protein
MLGTTLLITGLGMGGSVVVAGAASADTGASQTSSFSQTDHGRHSDRDSRHFDRDGFDQHGFNKDNFDRHGKDCRGHDREWNRHNRHSDKGWEWKWDHR